MLALIKVFIDIALWRKGPQDLPASGLLLAVATAAYLAVSLALAGVRQAVLPDVQAEDQGRVLVRALIELALVLAWMWLLLAMFQRPGRFRQSATALMGIGMVISPAVIGANLILERVGAHSPVFWPVWFAFLASSIWYLLVVAHILRSALETRLFPAIVLTVLFVLCMLLIEIKLFGMPT